MKQEIPINKQTGKYLIITTLGNSNEMFVYTHTHGVTDVSTSEVILSSSQLQKYIERVSA